MKHFTFLFSVLFSTLLFSGVLQAQATLAEKIAYAERLKQEARQYESQGFYDQSVETSKKLKALLANIDDLVAVGREWYALQRRISVAKQIGAERIAAEDYNTAFGYYKSSYQFILEEKLDSASSDIALGMDYAERAIEKTRAYLEEQSKKTAVKDTTKSEPKLEVVKIDEKYYTVRLIPSRRDSLWRIAEYPFVYNDPWKWKRIYQANKNIIDDPDLIYPGQKLTIPPLTVEVDN